MFQELKSLIEAKQQHDAQLRIQTEQVLHKVLEDLFREYPSLTRMAWKQYTPYFNDGDACVFGIGSLDVEVRNKQGEEENPSLKLSDSIDMLQDLLGDIRDVLQIAFGDHVQVVVTREKFEITEYHQHD